jgi:hypothetical protein
MSRKKNKRAANIESDAEALTATAEIMLNGAWVLAKRFRVCPVCLIMLCASVVEKALDDGEIEHGVAPLEDGDEVAVIHTGTLQ